MQNTITSRLAEERCEWREIREGSILSRLFSFLLLFTVCFNLTFPANAYSVVHIQASIDLATWEILTGVVKDEVGLTACSPEWKRMKEDDLKELSQYNYNSLSLIEEDKVETRDKKLANSGFLSGLANLTGITDEKGRVLTFPTDQENRNSSTSTDMESALNANNAIVFDLNQAFRVYCERQSITKTPDATAMLSAIKGFISTTSSNQSGDYISYYASANGTTMTNYRWRTEKYQGGSEKITWSMLIVEAFNNFSLEGEEAVDADNVYAGNPNQLTKAVVGFFSGMLDSIRSILGLWTMDELLFNEGWRSSGYVGGIFPVSWEPTIWALFMFTEIIAAMILLVGVVMSILKQAASTMNTIARIHAMSQIQDLFVCAIALTLLPLALRMVIAMSGNLVSIVSAMRPDSLKTGNPKTVSEMVERFSSGNGTMGGLIAQCLFFGAQVYFNFFYALRALATAILIIMAPMMIALITVSSAKKQTTMTWLKELLANILVQPIHTFCITVILLLPTSTHGFDNLIAIYAMIPFTAMIRSLFFGPAGGFIDQAASKGAAITNGAISGAAMGMASKAGSGLLGFAKERLGGGGGDAGTGGSDGSEGGESAGGTNTELSNASAARNSNTSNAGASNGSTGGPTGTAGSENGSSPGSGAAQGGADGDSGSFGPDTTAASIASAQNSNSPSGSSQSSHQNTSGTSNAAKSASLKGHWNSFKNSSTGQSLGGLARIGAGAVLGGIGGAFTGAGLYQIGNPISTAGDSLVASRGQQKKESEERNKDAEQSEGQASSENAGNESGTDANLPRPQRNPVDLDSVGKRKANDSSGDKEMQVRDLDQKELNRQGISDIDDSRKTMEFTAKGNSAQSQELGAYADYLKSLPPDQRRKEVNDRGIEATRTDDGIQVRIDKNKWSQANNGAEISARTNAKTGDTTMRIKSPEGGKAPSFTGAASPAKSGVQPVNIPQVTHSLTSVRKKGGKEETITRPRDVEQKLIDNGITGTAAARAAERVGAIRALQAQNIPPVEAARLSKKMVSGIQSRRAELSIPKAELSPSQTATMIQAVQSGEAAGTPSVYRAEYEPGMPDPVFGPENAAPTSFFERMNPTPAEGTPAVVEPAPSGGTPTEHPASLSVGTPIEVSAETPTPMQTSTSTSEVNEGTTVQNHTSTQINPMLAERARVYKETKQQTGSTTQAYAATKNLTPTLAPVPAPNRAPGTETSSIKMIQSNSQPAHSAPPVAVRTGPTPTPVSIRPAPSRSWAPSPNKRPAPLVQPVESTSPPARSPQRERAAPNTESVTGAPPEGVRILSPEDQAALNADLMNGLLDDPFTD